MENTVLFLNMFSNYEPPEALKAALSQAAIVAADLDPDERKMSVAIHSNEYIPNRLLSLAEKDLCEIYGLRRLQLTAVHPADQLSKIEPEELLAMFVGRNSMTRGVWAGASW